MSTKAGEGEHHYYLLKLQGADPNDTAMIEARKHYLGVDAVRWYVNQQGGFLRDRMASGTVLLSLPDETYKVGLGGYQLEAGARTAPIFDRPILPNRLYRGGRLTVEVFIRAIEQDTLLGGLLRDMAKASLGVVAGAVGAATATGPSAVLLAAGTSLVGGVQKILNEGKKAATVLDPGGLEVTLKPADLSGVETYLLIHRGAELDRDQISLTSDRHGAFEVIYAGTPLDDGAWVLFRLRREDRYGSPRPWEDEARQVRSALANLIDMWSLDGITQEEAKAQLIPRGTDPPSLGDEAMSVVAQIRADHVLAEREATAWAGDLRSRLALAQHAVRKNDPSIYHAEWEETEAHLAAGDEPPPRAAKVYAAEANIISSIRAVTLPESAPDLSGKVLWRTLRYAGPGSLE